MRVILQVFMLIFSIKAVAATNADNQGLPGTIKEIYVNGSIEGDKLRAVYSLSDMSEDALADLKKVVQVQDLKELGALFHTAGDNDYEFNDYQDAVQLGAEASVDSLKQLPKSLKKIITAPADSIGKIPGSYKVNFERAQDSFYNSNNVLAGTVKYAGWALWAQVEGAYYLVVEAPVRMVSNIIASGFNAATAILAIPVMVAVQTIRVAYKVVEISVKFTYRVLSAAARATYSLLSTTTAAALTTAVAGGIAIYKGGRWLVRAPRLISVPYAQTQVTDYNFDEQEEVAQKVKTYLQTLGSAYEITKEKINKFKSKFTVTYKGAKALIVRTSIKDKAVAIKAEATRKFKRMLQSENSRLDNDAVKAVINTQLTSIVSLQ